MIQDNNRYKNKVCAKRYHLAPGTLENMVCIAGELFLNKCIACKKCVDHQFYESKGVTGCVGHGIYLVIAQKLKYIHLFFPFNVKKQNINFHTSFH